MNGLLWNPPPHTPDTRLTPPGPTPDPPNLGSDMNRPRDGDAESCSISRPIVLMKTPFWRSRVGRIISVSHSLVEFANGYKYDLFLLVIRRLFFTWEKYRSCVPGISERRKRQALVEEFWPVLLKCFALSTVFRIFQLCDLFRPQQKMNCCVRTEILTYVFVSAQHQFVTFFVCVKSWRFLLIFVLFFFFLFCFCFLVCLFVCFVFWFGCFCFCLFALLLLFFFYPDGCLCGICLSQNDDCAFFSEFFLGG